MARASVALVMGPSVPGRGVDGASVRSAAVEAWGSDDDTGSPRIDDNFGLIRTDFSAKPARDVAAGLWPRFDEVP
jgi:hypothetical protein